MVEKNEKVNSFSYTNIILNYNHKTSGKDYLPLLTRSKKSRIMNQSNSYAFRESYLNNEINNSNNSNTVKNNKIKKLITDKKIELGKKQNNKNYINPNKTITKYDYLTDFRNRESNKDNKDMRNNFYKLICLGKETRRSDIEKVNSPLLKYYLYNIFQNNKRNINTNRYSYYSRIYNNNKNFNETKPNFILIKKNLRHKYNYINNKNNERNIFENYQFFNNIKKENELNYEESSSSENNQINLLEIEKIMKKEKNKTENSRLKLKAKNLKLSSFFKTNNAKKILKGYSNINFGKTKHLKIIRDVNIFKSPSFSLRKKIEI